MIACFLMVFFNRIGQEETFMQTKPRAVAGLNRMVFDRS
jgi:hypothetical protein